jgi:hypothetical protein
MERFSAALSRMLRQDSDMITQPSDTHDKSLVKKYCGNAEKKIGPCLKIHSHAENIVD